MSVTTEPLPPGRAPCGHPCDLPAAAGACAHCEELRRELRSTQREYEIFTGRIAHDLRAVLHAIDGFAEALEARAAPRTDERERHYLERVRANATRGKVIVDEVLGFFQLSTVPLDLAAVPVEPVIRSVCRAIDPDNSVLWRIESPLPRVQADLSLLRAALRQLLSNAVRFRSPDRLPEVEIAATVSGAHCELRVTDNGIGFDPADAHRLFQPFSRLHDTPDAASGMGLAAVKRIAERHGGWVDARGTPGAGAAFSLALPVAAGDLVGSASERPIPAQRKLRVLIVDDDPLVLMTIATVLERDGHAVTSVGSGAQALVAFEHASREAAFDVVFTDWAMPGIGGENVAQAIKKFSPATPLYVLTGVAPTGVPFQCRIDGMLRKPLRLADLRGTLQRVAAGPQAAA